MADKFFTKVTISNIAFILFCLAMAIAGGVIHNLEPNEASLAIRTTGDILLGVGISFILVHGIVVISYIIWKCVFD